jgi:Ca-activated chloride channel homolog
LAEKTFANETVAGTILLMTDGVDPASFDAIGKLGGRNNLIILGIGTAEGGPVKMGDGNFATDSSGGRLFAKLMSRR